MEILLVLGLIAIGLLLIFIEALFIPGSIWIGLIGCILSILGIIGAYQCYGNFIGTLTFAATSMAGIVTFYYGFKTKTWNKWALHSRIDSKATDSSYLHLLSVGSTGQTLSALRPMGSVDFGYLQAEVRAQNGYIEAGKMVFISKIEAGKIYVEAINTTV
ncbi:MAG: hypothetical protein EAZ67_04560 [Cytophagales bacterium]|nr:MAG: hypothetical protein EAZ67_04560 [Cytophagales bacterium]